MPRTLYTSSFFFFNDTATTEIYTLSLHDALPICAEAPSTGCSPHSDRRRRAWDSARPECSSARDRRRERRPNIRRDRRDRKSTRLNSSHSQISYAVFCLKKKKIDLTTML